MHPTDSTARLAGALYLVAGLPAPFILVYVPRLIVRGDPAATAENVLASEMLFRFSIVGGLLSGTAFIFLAWTLYRLLEGVNKRRASIMVSLVLVSVAIGFLNQLHNVTALTLFRGADFLPAFDKPQRDALAMLFLDMNRQGNLVQQIFWGLWLFPFGLLVMKAEFLPRILGILLIVNAVAYVISSITWLLIPSYGNIVSRLLMPATLGELWIVLWLLIKGVRWPPAVAPAP